MSGVVIGVGAVIGAVVGGGSSIFRIGKQNRSAVGAFKKQMKYLQMNYNYNQASLDRQERSMYDNALGELFSLSLNAYQNNAQVEAAIAETGLEGRSQEKIVQTIRGQTARQETATKEAYLNDVWNVRFQKDALYIQTKASVEQARDNLNNNLIGGSKAFQQFLNGAITGATMGAVTAGIGSSVGGTAGGTAGAIASTGMSGASSSASIASNTGGNFLGNVVANYQQYKPYVDFVQQWAKYYNSNITPRERGGYFY